jgi:hypothetical protein
MSPALATEGGAAPAGLPAPGGAGGDPRELSAATGAAGDPGATADGTQYAWEVRRDGTVVATGSGPTLLLAPDGDGLYEVRVTVTDAQGNTTTLSGTFRVVLTPAPGDDSAASGAGGGNPALAIAAGGGTAAPAGTAAMPYVTQGSDGEPLLVGGTGTDISIGGPGQPVLVGGFGPGDPAAGTTPVP